MIHPIIVMNHTENLIQIFTNVYIS